MLCCSVRSKGISLYMICHNQEHVWCTHSSFWMRSKVFTLWTSRHCKQRPQDRSRWTLVGVHIVILGGSQHCMCTILRPTMAHHKVHTLGHFSSIQWPGSKTSYIHVHIYDVCFTCMNWHKKQHNQTNHQYQHVVAVEKNNTVITCTWTPCNRWSVESMQKEMPVTSGD